MRIPAILFVHPPVLGNRDLLWREKIRYLMTKGLAEELAAFLGSRRGSNNFGLWKSLGFHKWSKKPAALRTMAIQDDMNAFRARKGNDPAAIAAENDLFLGDRDVRPRELLEFGNRTWSHPVLTLLSAEAQTDEIPHGRFVSVDR